MKDQDSQFLQRAVELAGDNVEQGGQPFGAVLVKDGEVLAEAVNTSHLEHDPTAHAETEALREAGKRWRRTQHPGSVMYASGKPCAMCLAAMYLANVERIVFAADDEDGAPYGLSTAELYAELAKPEDARRMQWEYLPIPAKRDIYRRWFDQRG